MRVSRVRSDRGHVGATGRCLGVALWLSVATACGPGAPVGEIVQNPLPELSRQVSLATLERLVTLGYTGATGEPAGEGGVRRRSSGEAGRRGGNLWSSGHAPIAFLTDHRGRRLHRWIWRPPPAGGNRYLYPSHKYWRQVHALGEDHLLALFEGASLVRIDRQSRLRWAYLGAPRDFTVLESGEILVLDAAPGEVIWLSATGEERRRLSVAECVERSDLDPLRRLARDGVEADAVMPFQEAWPAGPPEFVEGNLLISLRQPEALAVIDPAARRVVWFRPGRLRPVQAVRAQDEMHLLAIELGDNHRDGGGASVLEIAPGQWQTRWRYRDRLLSATGRASAQRLADGNTLITETDRGRAFEVTPAGEVVWEFINPMGTGPARGYRAALMEMKRLPTPPDARPTG